MLKVLFHYLIVTSDTEPKQIGEFAVIIKFTIGTVFTTICELSTKFRIPHLGDVAGIEIIWMWVVIL